MRGVPVKMHDKAWDKKKLDLAVERGPHIEQDFLAHEFSDMINNSQWIILPYSVAKKLPHLRISPPGVVPQRNRRFRWICDHTFSGVGPSSIHLIPSDTMQYGKALDR